MKQKVTENLVIFVITTVGLCTIILMDHSGMPQRWHAAIVGTAVTFGGVMLVDQRKWPHGAFWLSLGICFVGHVVMVWVVFQQLLSSVRTLGILIWAPIAFAEGILLLGAVPIIERIVRRKNE
jgi:hypothetical protein